MVWLISDIKLGGKPITEDKEKKLFGSSYERLGQERRMKILTAFELITGKQYDDFNFLRNCRRPYLHSWTIKANDEKKDALCAFKKALKLFKQITGVGIKDGKLIVNPLILKLCESGNLD